MNKEDPIAHMVNDQGLFIVSFSNEFHSRAEFV